ncbi:MAG: hypothetical protein SRB1_02237 [Desulfobacteraceae bacterium Eth-SRB1]|nr:MAG: hypothetical protein SRB1_02237 [Desulfobacteraceae bacterium Eth-SRB1]
MKRNEAINKKKLLSGLPYKKSKLQEFNIRELKMLASLMSLESWGKTKEELVKQIFNNQRELDLLDERLENFCEMCGNYVAIRQNAHVVAESGRARINMLKLCPSCHVMFDTRLKPRLYEALKNAGVEKLPKSWQKSIYYQAFEASMKSPKRKTKKND